MLQAFAEPRSADRPAGLPAGEQPARGAQVPEDGVAVPGGDELTDERVERVRQQDGFAAELPGTDLDAQIRLVVQP